MERQPQCVCVNLRRATRALTQLYDAALAEAGVKVTQFSLLRAIERNQPAAISTLADELDLDRTTLSRNLLPLQRDRLVVLAAGADQRVTEVRLTTKGRQAIAAALPRWQQVQEEIASRLGARRIEQLREIAAAATGLSARAPASARRPGSRRRSAPA